MVKAFLRSPFVGACREASRDNCVPPDGPEVPEVDTINIFFETISQLAENCVKMRTLGLSVFSMLLTGLVIGNAYYQKKQFYPSVVYITKSNPSMAVSFHMTSTVASRAFLWLLWLIGVTTFLFFS